MIIDFRKINDPVCLQRKNEKTLAGDKQYGKALPFKEEKQREKCSLLSPYNMSRVFTSISQQYRKLSQITIEATSCSGKMSLL